jgi:hypothetical protein
MSTNAVAANRLVLVARERPAERPPSPGLRHYRLARARVAELRAPKPALAHLTRMHD